MKRFNLEECVGQLVKITRINYKLGTYKLLKLLNQKSLNLMKGDDAEKHDANENNYIIVF